MRTLLALSVAFLLPGLVCGQTHDNSFRSWGVEQATGRPNTAYAGDQATAWASATPDEQDEWLELKYEAEIEPEHVFIYESYNPGAVTRVCGFTSSGMEAELWSGKDPIEPVDGIGVAEIKVKTKFKTNRIRIYINSKDFPGYNEIDAVGLKDDSGKVHWAVQARASSCYAGRSTSDVRFGPVRFDDEPEFLPRVVSTSAPDSDDRDERIERLEQEVRELRRLVEELVESQKRSPPKK